MSFSIVKRVLVVVSIFAVTFAFLLYTNLSTSLSNTRELMGSYEPEKVSTKFQDLQDSLLLSKLSTKEPQKRWNGKLSKGLNHLKQYADSVPYLFNKNFTPSYILGSGTGQKVSIVIGIPSVKRSGASYLFNTLQSLFHDMYPANEERVCVVVFLAEEDQSFVESTGKKIYETYTRQVNNGLLQVIAPDVSVYPNFNKLQRTLGDSMDRVKWRSKEVYDAAYLMLNCVKKADYYLMMEDDVIAARGYIGSALDFISKHEKENFAYLALANFNSIGKVYKMGDVPSWATYFLTFYVYKPIDWLMSDYVNLISCYPGMPGESCRSTVKQNTPQIHPGIFQHIGKQSSLEGKVQNIVDNHFSHKPVSSNPHKNPAAKVTSSLASSVDGSSVQSWYDDSGGMNAHYHVKGLAVNQTITVTLVYPKKMAKILVKTGMHDTADRLPLTTALLEYQYKTSEYQQCAVFDHNGEAECRFIDQPIKSIRIRLLRDISSNTWFDSIFIK